MIDIDREDEEKVVCVVTAHPDDEAMFFVPTITALKRMGCRLHLLCLSTGDCCGLGDVRKAELRRSCAILGISYQSVHVVDDPRLRDGMQTHWPEDVVKEIVSSFIIHKKVKTIVTFDPCGISSHPNHMAVCVGARRVVGVTRLELKSTNILQKFMGPLEACAYYLLQSCLKRQKYHVYINLDLRLVWKAMSSHSSQFVWYRRLFIVFSRYSYVNTFCCKERID
eukprot:546210_1